MNKQLKILKRTIILEEWINRISRQALREIIELTRVCFKRWLIIVKQELHNLLSTKSFIIGLGGDILGYQQGLSRDVIEMLLGELSHSES